MRCAKQAAASAPVFSRGVVNTLYPFPTLHRASTMPADTQTGEIMHWTDRRERYRATIAGSDCIHPGSVYDAISARIAEELGFEIGMFAGSIASFTVLGAPDLIVLTLTEFAD